MQSQSTSQTAVRVSFQDKTRRIKLSDVSFTCLAKSVSERFDVSAPVCFGYMDEEGDFVQVSSDQELQFALNHFQRKLKLIAKPSQAEVAPAQPVAKPSVADSNTKRVPLVSQTPTEVATVVPPAASLKPASAPAVAAPVNAVTVAEETTARKQRRASQSRPASDAKAPVLKAKSVRLVSQFFLVKGNEEPNQKRKLIVAPGTKFTKVWKIRNDSQGVWPADTRLSLIQGDQDTLDVPASTRVKALNPSEEGEVKITGKAPKETGKFSCVFRFTSNDKPVGRKLKVVVVVKEPKDEENKKFTEEVKSNRNEFGSETARTPRVKRERRPRRKEANTNDA
mmetsp:Transcript_19185/g.26856  ORF Transcript_19185/g.26856 Transcript_19185/m.26856 type:complete len:338 (-) Transcript_19185:50-1063(-)